MNSHVSPHRTRLAFTASHEPFNEPLHFGFISVGSLTPTEFKVLYTLASLPQKVFTRQELVQKALGYEFEGYERSIDAHIKNIRHKIEDDPRNPSFIMSVYGVGYRFSGKKDA